MPIYLFLRDKRGKVHYASGSISTQHEDSKLSGAVGPQSIEQASRWDRRPAYADEEASKGGILSFTANVQAGRV